MSSFKISKLRTNDSSRWRVCCQIGPPLLHVFGHLTRMIRRDLGNPSHTQCRACGNSNTCVREHWRGPKKLYYRYIRASFGRCSVSPARCAGLESKQILPNKLAGKGNAWQNLRSALVAAICDVFFWGMCGQVCLPEVFAMVKSRVL